jgi:glycosyltransferase involved in cell wall biosynthesis
MAKVSVVVPSRNETYLTATVKDLIAKARGDIEVIVLLENYLPEEFVHDGRVIYVYSGRVRGLRGSSNLGVSIASGEYVMKIDAHCMFDRGYDVKLAEDCEDDWVVVPRRKRLDAERWMAVEDGRPDIDYMYLSYPKDIVDPKTAGFHGRLWEEKNRDEGLKDELIVDLMSAQGSCWFMRRDYIKKLELFDDEHYGTFANEFQEIGLKCWLSGGRVVRNKKTWYAHLHKKQRGYSLSKATVAQANEWTKKWATNDAWDRNKVKHDLKWLIDKFAPVPEWEEHDWSEWGAWSNVRSVPTTARAEEEKKIAKVYQNVVIDGVDRGQNPDKRHSKFWNGGKWNNFVAPLLIGPAANETFVEMGCNSGLFLQLAKGAGYETVVGVDKSRSACKVGEEYRKVLGLDYRILHRTVGVNYDWDEVPVADVTLLSTVHYYFDITDWLAYLDRLRWKTLYCLIVSRSVDPDAHWRPSGEMADIRNYFRDWTEVGAISDVSTKGDPSPRELWSLAFKSNLTRMNIDDIYIKNERHGTWTQTYKEMDGAKRELAELVSSKHRVDMEDTAYFKKWKERVKGQRRWTDKRVREFVGSKIKLMEDVRDNGLRDPIIVKLAGQICDGGHRLAILRAMGHKTAIVRFV